MTSPALAALLQEFYRDKHALAGAGTWQGAQHVPAYEFNNTYQYIINREDTQLAVGASRASRTPGPGAHATGRRSPVPGGKGEASQRAIIEDDARLVQAFHDKWAPRQGGDHATSATRT